MEGKRTRPSGAHEASASLPFRVLFVCTGNICRSPLAEQLFRAALLTNGMTSETVTVSSAGLNTTDGVSMDRESARMSEILGGVSIGAVSSVLQRNVVLESDLIVVMTVEQQIDLVQRYPMALNRTFPLLQLARLLSLLESEADMTADHSPSMRDMVGLAARNRSRALPTKPADHDIKDPYREPRSVHEQVARRISESVLLLARALSAK